MKSANTHFVSFSSNNMSVRSFLSSDQSILSTRFHFHNGYEVCYIASGNTDYSVNGYVLHLVEGDCIIIPPYTMHKIFNSENGNKVLLNFFDSYLKKGFSKSVAKEILNRVSDKDYIILHDKTNRIASVFDEINEEAKKPKQGEAYAYLGELLSVFSEKKITINDIVPIPKCVESTIEFIQNHYSSPITLNDVSQKTGFTKNYICSAFKQHFGITANEYLTGLRLKNACYMLSETNYSEKKIAQNCGFSSLSYFIKVFTKHLNETPASYRKGLDE